MTTLDWLDHWKQRGVVTGSQHEVLSALIRRERFSVYPELNALFYLGVLSLVGGLAWTVQTHFSSLGDVAIIAGLTLALIAAFYYCFSRIGPFSVSEVASPSFAFDYVLYGACLILSVELGYLEFRFEWLRDAWELYLLFLAMVFGVLAYRFDNRLVLSLALSSLASWCGLKTSHFWNGSSGHLRGVAIAYGLLVAGAGVGLHRAAIKKHFLETYLHVGAIVVFIALVSGLRTPLELFYLAALLLLAAGSIAMGFRFKRFAFVVYGTSFGYIGISAEVLSNIVGGIQTNMLYFVVSGIAVVFFVARLARKFGRES